MAESGQRTRTSSYKIVSSADVMVTKQNCIYMEVYLKSRS